MGRAPTQLSRLTSRSIGGSILLSERDLVNLYLIAEIYQADSQSLRKIVDAINTVSELVRLLTFRVSAPEIRAGQIETVLRLQAAAGSPEGRRFVSR